MVPPHGLPIEAFHLGRRVAPVRRLAPGDLKSFISCVHPIMILSFIKNLSRRANHLHMFSVARIISPQPEKSAAGFFLDSASSLPRFPKMILPCRANHRHRFTIATIKPASGKPVAGFLNRTAAAFRSAPHPPVSALSQDASQASCRPSSLAGTRERAGTRRGQVHARPRPPLRDRVRA